MKKVFTSCVVAATTSVQRIVQKLSPDEVIPSIFVYSGRITKRSTNYQGWATMKTNSIYLCRLFVAMVLLMMGLGNVGLAVTVTLGDQDFTDGSFISGAAAFNAASVGEPPPFDKVRGSDYGTSFNGSWTFHYSALSVTSATLTLGIVDHDSAAPGSQISSFTVDSIDITSVLNDLFESRGGRQVECNVYTINLLAPTFSALSDGIATFALTLQGPGLEDGGGTTSGNAAGLDFATLTVVPEPATICLLGLGGLLLGRNRKSNKKQK